jgi:hypothetical protein
MTVGCQRAERYWNRSDMTRRALLGVLVAVAASIGAPGASASPAPGVWSDAPLGDASNTLALAAAAVPAGYWVDVDESGATTSGGLGGSGSIAATGTGNVNYGFAKECAPSVDGGPFSSGKYPPATCPELGRPYSSAGSPEEPSGFWFTGNQNCVKAGRLFSGSAFTWHAQLPQTGYWHVDVYIPSWTSYGWGDQYILTAADGRFENYPVTQQAYHGQWVSLFGSHSFTAGPEYSVELTPADGSDANCHYQMADQMRWVYDGPSSTAPVNMSAPTISGQTVEGQTLTESHGSWSNNPTSYEYQWEGCDGSGGHCSPISGANSQSYTLLASDVGHTIVVEEIATNTTGSSSPATSQATSLVTLPTVSATSVEPSPQQPKEPAECAVTPRAAMTTRHPVDKRLARRVTGGARKLMAAKSVRVKIAITVCGATAREAGVAPGTRLTGAGTVDASRTRARWTITLPPSFGSHVMSVISHGSETYIRADSLGLNAHKPWIRIHAREFRNIRRLGFLGVLAADTNPAAEVGLAADTRPESGHSAVTARSDKIMRSSLDAHTGSDGSCNVTGGATLSGPLDLHNDKTIIGRAKAWRDAANSIRSSSNDIRSIIRLNRGGTLTSVTVATLKGQTAALTVTDDLCPEGSHDPGQDPITSSVPKLGSVFLIDPCLVGNWLLHQGYPNGSGYVSIAISPTGAMTLAYFVTEPSLGPLMPSRLIDDPPYLTETATETEVEPPISVTGVATGEVIAPLSTEHQSSHRLVWAIISSTVTSHIPGYLTVAVGEEGKVVPLPEEIIIDEVPFRRVHEVAPFNYLNWQLHNSSKYECDESHGIGTLKVQLPFNVVDELEFQRAGRTSNG